MSKQLLCNIKKLKMNFAMDNASKNYNLFIFAKDWKYFGLCKVMFFLQRLYRKSQ
ncbi:hypothetical protein LEP1GSC059_1882 [Leptospira noguchii serovar Panama str. CZ214]|uniref:Uncharacterized protein n=1 Tax=Leptospira noguchii serovar Panama str. CZ214 TaxID=1001595 RepID=T0F8J0_9LEPT|nr:hypothetical protein LEP1GSC059_1882 [Leptospira noguchii serovar Panama str. CZ214]